MFDGQPADEIAAARMTDEMRPLDTQRAQRRVCVLDRRMHRVVVVRSGVFRVALSQLVDGEDTEPLRKPVEIEIPVVGRAGARGRAERAAMHQHHRLAGALFEISGPDPLDVDEFCARYRHWLFPRPLCFR